MITGTTAGIAHPLPPLFVGHDGGSCLQGRKKEMLFLRRIVNAVAGRQEPMRSAREERPNPSPGFHDGES